MLLKILQVLKVEIFNSFNSELQSELHTESVIKTKQIDLFTQLKGFKFVANISFGN